MIEVCKLIWCGLIGLFRSRALLEIEILALRQQLNILRRKSPKRPTFGSIKPGVRVCRPVEHPGWDEIPQDHVARHGFELMLFQGRLAEHWRALVASLDAKVRRGTA